MDNETINFSKKFLTSNESLDDSEITRELGNQEPAVWNEPPTDSGHRILPIRPEDDHNPSKDLVEKGLREPNRSRNS